MPRERSNPHKAMEVQASSSTPEDVDAVASEASTARQDEAALLVFDVLAAAGQQLNGNARWSQFHTVLGSCLAGIRCSVMHQKSVWELTALKVARIYLRAKNGASAACC